MPSGVSRSQLPAPGLRRRRDPGRHLHPDRQRPDLGRRAGGDPEL